MNQLSIFDELDQEQERIEAEKAAEQQRLREIASQPVQCEHCGEWSPNQYLWETNHGKPHFYDMQGVCVKHWFLYHQSRWQEMTKAREWLTERGFAVHPPEGEWTE